MNGYIAWPFTPCLCFRKYSRLPPAAGCAAMLLPLPPPTALRDTLPLLLCCAKKASSSVQVRGAIEAQPAASRLCASRALSSSTAVQRWGNCRTRGRPGPVAGKSAPTGKEGSGAERESEDLVHAVQVSAPQRLTECWAGSYRWLVHDPAVFHFLLTLPVVKAKPGTRGSEAGTRSQPCARSSARPCRLAGKTAATTARWSEQLATHTVWKVIRGRTCLRQGGRCSPSSSGYAVGGKQTAAATSPRCEACPTGNERACR